MLVEDWISLALVLLLWRSCALGDDEGQQAKDSSGFYQGAAWRRLRRKTLKENKRYYGRPTPTCERCGSHGGQRWRRILIALYLAHPDRMRWEVDHIKARSTHPHLALRYENTQVLCKRDNRVKSNLWGLNWKRLRRWDLDLLCPPLSVFVALVRG